MPWYYAGPEAKPVGPVTLDELQALRAARTISAETYVIEQTGQPAEALAWKRYQDVFPAMPNLPPVPSPDRQPVAPPFPPPASQAHPLFPSAAPAPAHPSVFPPGARPDPYYNVRPTNGWCGWGFGLGLTALFFSFACGMGLLPALVSLPLCIIGLAQVHKRREQAGQGLAVAGLILSTVALIISLVFVLYLAMPILKAHGLTVTEQTTNDSE
jgi:hypothetical protein